VGAIHPLPHGPDNLAGLGAGILRRLLNEPIFHVPREPDGDLGQITTAQIDASNKPEQTMATSHRPVNIKVATGHLDHWPSRGLMSSDFPSRGLDKFVLRLPDGMRDKIGVAARANKRTMNAEIVQRLEVSFSSMDEPLQVVNENTAEADMLLALKRFRAEFAAIRETRRIVGELLEAVKALTKSISPEDQSKKD
jgi:hypothetical protein